MDSFISTQVERQNAISNELKTLFDLRQDRGVQFPGSDYHPPDRKNWMSVLNPEKVHINKIVWPGTHNSATNEVGIPLPLISLPAGLLGTVGLPLIQLPIGQCQSLSIYEQLARGTRVLDIRVQEHRLVCHGILVTYSIDVVIKDIKMFLSETQSEIILLEIRTEYEHQDPPEFDKYLESQLGDFLIRQDDNLFGKTIAQVLPKRIICVWKPRNSPQPEAGSLLWSLGYLKDNWTDTNLPYTKYVSNWSHLVEQQPVSSRKFFYRVENTITPQADNPASFVTPLTEGIHGFARCFIADLFFRGYSDRLQIFSTDYISEDFVDACVGLTYARVEGNV